MEFDNIVQNNMLGLFCTLCMELCVNSIIAFEAGYLHSLHCVRVLARLEPLAAERPYRTGRGF